MNKNTNRKNHNTIEHKLKAYSALAAGLIAFANNSQAQIVIKTLKPDTTISNGSYLLDLNGDGTPDFKLKQISGTSHFSSVSSYDIKNTVEISPLGKGNQILDTLSSAAANPYTAALNLNTSIGSNPKKFVWNSAKDTVLLLNYDRIKINPNNNKQYPHYYGNWQGVTDKYLGLLIEVKEKTYYGWVRLDVAKDAKSFTIKSYAYDTIHDQSIQAGDSIIATGISKNNELPFKTIIYTHYKDLYIIFNSPEPITGTINLFTLTGQLLKSAEVVTDENHVRLEDIASGIYMLNIQTSKGIISRKIYIQ